MLDIYVLGWVLVPKSTELVRNEWQCCCCITGHSGCMWEKWQNPPADCQIAESLLQGKKKCTFFDLLAFLPLFCVTPVAFCTDCSSIQGCCREKKWNGRKNGKGNVGVFKQYNIVSLPSVLCPNFSWLSGASCPCFSFSRNLTSSHEKKWMPKSKCLGVNSSYGECCFYTGPAARY